MWRCGVNTYVEKVQEVSKGDKWGQVYVCESFILFANVQNRVQPLLLFCVFFLHNINCFSKHLKFPKVTKSQKSWAMITFYFSKSHFISVSLTTFICRAKNLSLVFSNIGDKWASEWSRVMYGQGVEQGGGDMRKSKVVPRCRTWNKEVAICGRAKCGRGRHLCPIVTLPYPATGCDHLTMSFNCGHHGFPYFCLLCLPRCL